MVELNPGESPYRRVAKIFTVKELGTAIPFTVSGGMSLTDLWEKFKELNGPDSYEYSICLVDDGVGVVGYIDYEIGEIKAGLDFESATVGEACMEISDDMVLSASAPILKAVPPIGESYKPMFVSDGNKITQYFYIFELDSFELRVSLFAILSMLEDFLVRYLVRYPERPSELIKHISQKSLELAKDRFRYQLGNEFEDGERRTQDESSSIQERKYKRIIQHCLSFADRVRIFSSIPRIGLEPEVKLYDKDTQHLVNVRNRVAHGMSIFGEDFSFGDYAAFLEKCESLLQVLDRYLHPSIDASNGV